MNFRFSKKEHLYGNKNIEMLFAEGNLLFVYPFRIIIRKIPIDNTQFPVRVLISVSKKRFKLAVDRNKIKRRIREVYRINKHQLIDRTTSENCNLHISLQYVSNNKVEFKELEEKMQYALELIEKKIF